MVDYENKIKRLKRKAKITIQTAKKITMYKLNINLKMSASNQVIKTGIDAGIKWLHAVQSALDKHTTGKEIKHKTICS